LIAGKIFKLSIVPPISDKSISKIPVQLTIMPKSSVPEIPLINNWVPGSAYTPN
jgi:hypothetical protein